MGISRLVLTAGGVVLVGFGVALLLRDPLLLPGEQLVLVGDSLSVGLAATAAYGGKGALQHECDERGIHLLALGKGSTTAAQWSGSGYLNRERLIPALAQHPRAVMIVLGTNDCRYDFGICQPVFAQNLLNMASEIHSAGAVPVLVGMPEMPWESSAAGKARMAFARAAMYTAAKVNDGVYLEPPPVAVARWSDGIHASAEGNRIWASYLMSVLDKTKRWR